MKQKLQTLIQMGFVKEPQLKLTSTCVHVSVWSTLYIEIGCLKRTSLVSFRKPFLHKNTHNFQCGTRQALEFIVKIQHYINVKCAFFYFPLKFCYRESIINR